jgi:CRP-like cAMP-binding protein
MLYHSDLKPGELFGDAALNGSTLLRSHTAVAVSHCSLLTVDVQDFARIRDHGHVLVSHEQRFHFLKQVTSTCCSLSYSVYVITVHSTCGSGVLLLVPLAVAVARLTAEVICQHECRCHNEATVTIKALHIASTSAQTCMVLTLECLLHNTTVGIATGAPDERL